MKDAPGVRMRFDGGAATLFISGAATRTVTLPAGAALPGVTVNAPERHHEWQRGGNDYFWSAF